MVGNLALSMVLSLSNILMDNFDISKGYKQKFKKIYSRRKHANDLVVPIIAY
jgi:hypothetical protein